MKAIIVKNDNFETIGFEVSIKKDGEKRVYHWGISPNPMYYTKQVRLTEDQLVNIIRLAAQIHEVKQFHERFWDIVVSNDKVMALDPSFNMMKMDDYQADLEASLMKYINSIS